MSKHGLGRGLSSLFSIYENDTQNQPEKTVAEKPIKQTSKTQGNTTDDVLQNAKNLINRLNNPNTKEVNIEKTPIKINEDVEPIENTNFLKDKQVLDEKFKKASDEGALAETGARIIALTKIEPNKEQPRKNFNQEALKELAQSIKLHGVIQPIVVSQRGDKYIIIAGERRYRASKIAGLQTVPVIIKNYTDQEMREISLIENLQREDLNPIETAFAMKQLIENYNFTQDDLAKRLGKSRPAITNALRLLNLSSEVMAMVESGKLAPNSARALLSITNKEKQIELAKKASNDKLTTRDLERIVQEFLSPGLAKVKNRSDQSDELLELRDFMQKILGTKVSFIGNDTKGRIYIDYYSRDDLDRIYSILNKLK